MNDIYKIAYKTLHDIYDKHRRKYRSNPDSKQMCCMWSTHNPPDVLSCTQPLCDIETAFDINIDENEALKLYDMLLDEAAKKIIEMQSVQR